MSSSDQMLQATTILRNTLRDVLQYSTVDLVREDALGQLNLAESQKTFDNIFKLFREVNDSDLTGLPLITVNTIQQHAATAAGFFGRVSGFTLTDQNPNQTRNTLVAEADGLWHQVFEAVSPKVAFLRKADSDTTRLAKELQESILVQQAAMRAASDEKDAILEDMKKTLGTIKDNAAEAGVTKHSGYFKDEADSHVLSASRWLKTALVFGLAMLAYSGLFLWLDHPASADANFYSSIHFIVPRLTILLVLGFALGWSSRNYSAAKHNEVVNRHRQNALNSFETFVKSTHDAETKNAVLRQATQSIFAPQDTAFSKNDVSAGPATQIVEIVRGISGSKSN
jgi:hypothetical protein